MQSKILWVSLTALLACAGSAFAVTIHVPADQPTIQAGINAAVDGDTVAVAPGTYTENLTVAKRAVIVSDSGATVTSLLPAVLAQTLILLSAGADSGTTFDGFTVQGSSAFAGIYVGVGTSLRINRCRFLHNPGGLVMVLCDGGTLSVEYCLFVSNGGGNGCVEGTGAAGSTTILNNTFDQNNRGFFFASGVCVAKNNIVSRSVGFGIYPLVGNLTYNEVWANNPDYQTAPQPGIGNISVDPEYVGAPTDYRLRTSSPCINAGDPANNYNDADGTRNDMGAFPTFFVGVSPEIQDISDVPHDQGGLVTVRWKRSVLDTPILRGVAEYSVWRAIPWNTAFAKGDEQGSITHVSSSASHPQVRMISTTLGSFAWEQVGTIVPHYFEFYAFTAPTLYDSSGATDGKHYFLVSAHSPDGVHFYDSEPDSGHSVDNLAPPAPQLISLSTSATGAGLRWHGLDVPDLNGYKLYRDTVAGVIALPGHLVATVGDTSFTDATIIAGRVYFYRVSALDFAGNEGLLSNELFGSYCVCPCHADPCCNGVSDILDVVGVINRAFRAGAPVFDASCTPYGSSVDGRTDVDCSGSTDVVDVVKMVNVAFRGQDPATQFCKPCL